MIERKIQYITQKFNPPKHNGVDLRSVDIEGQTYDKQYVMTIEDCKVLRASWIDGPDKFGNDFIVLEPTKNFDIVDELKYIHIMPFKTYEKDEIIEAGTPFAITAIRKDYFPERSNSEAHHLHFECLKRGQYIDPVKYMNVNNIKYEGIK